MAEEQLAGLMVAGHRLTPEVSASLHEASATTGVNFDFLVAQATVESGLRNVQARHSSAAGLFQFTAQTWLRMIRAHGAQYGLGDLASEITTLGNGHLGVSDGASEQKILDLRQDVKLSAIMAGELAKENGAGAGEGAAPQGEPGRASSGASLGRHRRRPRLAGAGRRSLAERRGAHAASGKAEPAALLRARQSHAGHGRRPLRQDQDAHRDAAEAARRRPAPRRRRRPPPRARAQRRRAEAEGVGSDQLSAVSRQQRQLTTGSDTLF